MPDHGAGDRAAQLTRAADPLQWPTLLAELMSGRSLSSAQTAWAMSEIMAGDASPAQLASFAVLLRAKGETAAELAGMVATMLDRATPVQTAGRAVDLVGTGGDGAHTVNITTMAALVVAGSGRPLLKHGNRSASSLCGSADVLEQLGVAIDLGPKGVAQTLAEVGIGFCFAPVFHPGMRFAGPPRREIGVPTAFNLLGPLTNPGRPAAAAVGCADLAMAPVMAEVLAARGDSALVFRGEDGLDELTVTADSLVWLVRAGQVRADRFELASVGLTPAPAAALRGGDPQFNAEVFRQVLGGQPGPIRDAVLLNAAAAIAAFDDELDSARQAIQHGLPLAEQSVDSGAAAAVLEAWANLSQQLAAPKPA